MNLIKRIITELVYVLRSIYEVLYIYPKTKYEELHEIKSDLNIKQ